MDDFDKEPICNNKSKSSNGFSTKKTKSYSKPKQTTHCHSQSQRREYNNNDHGVSNPAYHRQLLGNKYRNGHLNNEYNTRKKRVPRQRPELHTFEQQQQYKQDLRQSSMNHLDQSLRTAYQSEEIAADTSEKLYYQRS